MSDEKRCDCCQRYWYCDDLVSGLCPNCVDYFALKNKINIEQDQKIKELQQQLAEKNELFIATKWKVDNLEKQLAEKDKEIEKLKKGVFKVTLGTTPSNQIDFTENFYVIQNQTAIAELEKVRTCFGDYLKGLFWNDTMLVGKVCNMINEIIDQQIKSLKGEK